jgi:hypothetical protein
LVCEVLVLRHPGFKGIEELSRFTRFVAKQIRSHPRKRFRRFHVCHLLILYGPVHGMIASSGTGHRWM